MEMLLDIFITLFLMIIVGGGFWCLLKLWGYIWDKGTPPIDFLDK